MSGWQGLRGVGATGATVIAALLVVAAVEAPAAAAPGDPPREPLVSVGSAPGLTWSRTPDPSPSESESEPPSAAPQERKAKALGEIMAGNSVLRLGDRGLPVKFVQQRLNTAGLKSPESGEYDTLTAAAVTHLQEKFSLTTTGRVNRYTLETLLQVTARGPVLPDECTTGTVLCIDKTQRILRLVVDGEVVATLDARFGAFGSATNDGMFEVYDKIDNDFSTQFGVPMKLSMYFSNGQAVHYSPFFARDGYRGASAGCVNTRDLAATQAVFDQVEVGTTKVFVYR